MTRGNTLPKPYTTVCEANFLSGFDKSSVLNFKSKVYLAEGERCGQQDINGRRCLNTV